MTIVAVGTRGRILIKGPKMWDPSGLGYSIVEKDHGTGSCAEGLSYDSSKVALSDLNSCRARDSLIGEGLFWPGECDVVVPLSTVIESCNFQSQKGIRSHSKDGASRSSKLFLVVIGALSLCERGKKKGRPRFVNLHQHAR